MTYYIESVAEEFNRLFGKTNSIGDLYLQGSSAHHLFLDDGKIEEASSSASSGVGARLVKDGATLYVNRPDTDSLSITESMTELADLAGYGKKITLKKDKPLIAPPKMEQFEKADLLHLIDDEIRKSSSKVSQVSLSIATSVKSILIIKDDGSYVSDRRNYSIFSSNVIVEDRGNIQTGYRVKAFCGSLEELLNSFDPLLLGKDALESALKMLDSPYSPAGTMPVLLSGEAGGTMIHEACGHGMEADIVKKDYSVYRDKIDHKIASSLITIVDDGTINGLYGSYSIDDEGIPSQRTILVDRGILKGYLTDRQTAVEMGLSLTGNGRRASYKVPPQPRMSNTFVEEGNSSFQELLESIDKGLLVKKMGGGEVNPTTGDYVFQVTEGYIVNKGKIAHPVKGAVLTGNGPDTLNHIIGVGKKLSFEPGMCGKGGQSVPVTDGQPTLLIDHITVGGSSTS